MRFIIMRKADADTEAGIMPSEALLEAMAKYNEELIKAGAMVDGMGLKPSSFGARVQFQNGKPVITDGPFAETKELLAGFTVIDVKSREEALEWVRRWPAEDGNGNATLELRQVFTLEDFGDSPAVKHHAALGEELARQKAQV